MGGRKSEKSDAWKERASSARWLILALRIPSMRELVVLNDWSQMRRESHSSKCVSVALLGTSLIRSAHTDFYTDRYVFIEVGQYAYPKGGKGEITVSDMTVGLLVSPLYKTGK